MGVTGYRITFASSYQHLQTPRDDIHKQIPIKAYRPTNDLYVLLVTTTDIIQQRKANSIRRLHHAACPLLARYSIDTS